MKGKGEEEAVPFPVIRKKEGRKRGEKGGALLLRKGDGMRGRVREGSERGRKEGREGGTPKGWVTPPCSKS